MKNRARIRILAGTAFILAASASGALARTALPCAQWVSSSSDREPNSGYLIGTETRTETGQILIQGSGVTHTVTYEVGYYQMASGAVYELDCRTYRMA